ncbi:MAG: sulfatase-like hydrolase/transferase [Chloroflexota bacterium]|nr:sulfatase-like hydrolase/transferase [Chloroflexota bacterium]MDE2908393.1 sulfatase-like hydrolase/transferase [Chloroflexota bacterium]
MSSQRPNILFLMSDQHRADIAGYAGDAIARTPALDKLARSGVVFNNAYTPAPICIPARQSMAAGQLPRTCGCEVFGEDLAPGHMTFARRLSQYGYATVACGKLHHNGADQMQGWTSRIGSGMNVRHDFIEGRNLEAMRDLPLATERKWSQAKEVKRAGIGEGPVNGHDAYTLDGALRFIENFFADPYYDRALPTRPLMLMVSFVRPHVPFLTTREKFTHYINRVTPYVDEAAFDHPFLGSGAVEPGRDVSEREIRRATAAYYGMVEGIDEDYGVVLAALEHVGQNLDDWIIIYTSDHGEMLGERQLWEKTKFFEGSVKAPLIIRLPGGAKAGRVVEENVNLCDLFATICDLTDVPSVAGLDSRSLVPLLNGDNSSWDNETVSHYGGTHLGHEAEFDRYHNLMIKRDELKYQYYGPDMPEVLFDLSANPEETVNFAADPHYSESLAAFRERLAELGYGQNAAPGYKNAGY